MLRCPDPATSSRGATTVVFFERTPNALRGDLERSCLKLLSRAILVRVAEFRNDPPTVTMLSADMSGMLCDAANLSSTTL